MHASHWGLVQTQRLDQHQWFSTRHGFSPRERLAVFKDIVFFFKNGEGDGVVDLVNTAPKMFLNIQ